MPCEAEGSRTPLLDTKEGQLQEPGGISVVSSRAKGQKCELDGLRELISEGWYLEARAPPSTKWNRQVDLCDGLFDAILSRIEVLSPQGFITKKRLYVQFKSNRKPSLEPFRKFKAERCNEDDIVMVMVRKDRKGFTRFIL